MKLTVYARSPEGYAAYRKDHREEAEALGFTSTLELEYCEMRAAVQCMIHPQPSLMISFCCCRL